MEQGVKEDYSFSLCPLFLLQPINRNRIISQFEIRNSQSPTCCPPSSALCRLSSVLYFFL